MKLRRFIKDDTDKNNTLRVLEENFPFLKNQFTRLISTRSYPVIDWLDFVGECQKWKIIDMDLTQNDIDRVFIATNFEEYEQDANDDNSLCRFEFLEIIVRLGKIKFYEKGKCKTIAESTRKFIQEYLVPNSFDRMEWQEFRSDKLWCLDVDDLLKAN